MKKQLAATAASLAAATVAYHALALEPVNKALVTLLVAIAPPVCLHFFGEYKKSKRLREIEENLPAALFQIASFPRKTSMERIMKSLSKSDYGPLSEEFARAGRLVNAGLSVPEALDEIRKRNNSILLERALQLLTEAYKSGADLGKAFKEVSEDIFDLQAMRKETASALALQKYTLLAGGCILVPLILGLVLNIVGALDVDYGLGIGASAAERRELFETSVWASQAYLIAFTGIASVFVSMQEGNSKKAVLYFSLLCPAGLLVFNIVRTITLI